MKNLFVVIPTIFVALLISVGCSIVEPAVDKFSTFSAKAVIHYCNEIKDEKARLEFREKVNDKARPHHVEVSCANDG